MDRRRFTLAALFPAAFFAGCHSGSEPSREATLFHNANVRGAMAELDQAMNALEMRAGEFNAENWQDALANLQTAIIRMRGDIDDLKRALGYAEPGS